MPLSSDPEGKRLPIKLDSTSNGEFVPVPLDATNRRANQLAQKFASENAKRRGVDRRAFRVSACGAASTLLAFNTANSAAGKNICVHTGLPFGRRSYKHSLASDIGVVAKMFPDVNFLVYHSGFIVGQPEGPYDPNRGEGVDELIRSVEENEIPRNGNVYAEIGSTWRYAMRDSDLAAHIIGKLVKHIGEKNVLYGSDCIWYGSPQDQIQALRTFKISDEFQEKYGYPKMTPQLRAGIFGLNAARPYGIDVDEVLKRARRDVIQHRRAENRLNPDPHFLTFGPKNRREFFANLKARGGSPV